MDIMDYKPLFQIREDCRLFDREPMHAHILAGDFNGNHTDCVDSHHVKQPAILCTNPL
jgi:hypothetical protein